jgi:hypothetical protein
MRKLYVLIGFVLILSSPFLASAASLEVYGGDIRAFGGSASDLSGEVILNGTLELHLISDDGMTVNSGPLAIVADTNSFTLEPGQFVDIVLGGGGGSVDAGNALITGLCGTGDALVCDFTLVGITSPFSGTINSLTAGRVTSSPIPEPVSGTLFAAGLILVGAAVRKES